MSQALDFYPAGAPLWGSLQRLLHQEVIAAASPFIHNAAIDWAGVNINFSVDAYPSPCTLYVLWYGSDPTDSATPSELMGVDLWHVRPGSSVRASISAKGPYLYLIAVPTDDPGPATVSLTIQYTNVVTGAFEGVSPILATAPGTALPAGTTSRPVAVPYAGPAYLHFATAATTWSLTVNVTGSDASPPGPVPIFAADQTTVAGGHQVNETIIIPPGIIDIDVVNGDIGASTYELTLTAATYNY